MKKKNTCLKEKKQGDLSKFSKLYLIFKTCDL